jgi:hypothetical protein
MPGQGNVKPTLKRQVEHYIQRQARKNLNRHFGALSQSS